MDFLNWFIDPVKNKYADFSGRAGRKEFWMFVLVYVIIYVILMAMNELLGLVYSLALLVPAIAITTRRLHDTGMSGWWQLLGLIPIVGWLVVIILTIRPGQSGANEYGQAPDGGPMTPEQEPSVMTGQMPTANPTASDQVSAPENNQSNEGRQ